MAPTPAEDSHEPAFVDGERGAMSEKPVAKALTASLFFCALLAALQMLGSVARADDSAMGATGGTATGGSIHPIWTTDVRMAAETVQAVCFGDFAEYRVVFRFVNDGKARKVKLGFPFTDTVTEHGTERPVGFQAWQNGRPLTVRAVKVRSRREGATAGYFIHEAVFPHGSTLITVSYLAHASMTGMSRRRGASANDRRSGMANWYEYWLHTGSTWKGPIGKAVVRYRFADTFRGRGIELAAKDASKFVPVTAPPHWTRPLRRTYQWQFSDFEPKPAHASDWWKPQSRFDVILGFANPDSRPPTRGRWTWSSVAEGFGEKGYQNVQDGLLDTCWAEGVPGTGVGEWVEKQFKRPVRLRELRILPGNNAYDSAFRKFARPKTLTAFFSDGSSRLLRFKDAPTLQRFPVHVTTRSVRFVVESVYEGTDYPATCISEVEFGTERAPRYAPFRRLISDPRATGRLAAWTGPAAPAPHTVSRTTDPQEVWDAEAYAGGDLIGISDWASFPADDAPFKEPASLGAVTARNPEVVLPERDLVGEPTAVNALSYWTYEIRYSSGIDLLVNTRLSRGSRVSLASELAKETRYMCPYTDHRKIPFDVVTMGRQPVGLTRPGVLACCSCGPARVPGQVFWRDGDRSYHLYARSDAVTTDKLIAVAHSMIEPQPVADVGGTDSKPASWPWWQALGVAAAAEAVMLAVILLPRRKTKVPSPPKAVDG
jgi:hypothetical protein